MDQVDIDYISKSDWVKPRRGEKYQAEIPSLVSKSEILKDSATLIWTGVAAEDNKSVSSWNETDVDAFVLGLYTFSKNFLFIKNFLVNKKMEELLSFYYGNFFFNSAKYKSWSHCRKKKSKSRVMFGKKIFKGRRMHQLLSSLYPQISDESQTALLEVSMSFEGRRISLLQYLACLKEIVGMKNLVETVEIGKAKHIEKNNQVFRFMPPNVPGIKKFSRRGLMKRIQYFDTISDILDKVVSEPKLIELENDENKEDICGEENDKVREELLEGNLPSDSNAVDNYIPSDSRNSKEMQFTVGSTSATNGKALESNSPRKFGEEHQDQDQLQDGQCLKSCESEEDNVPLVKRRRLTSFVPENFLDDEKSEEDGHWYDIHSHLGTGTKVSAICIDLTDVGLNSANTNEKVEQDYQWYDIHSHLGTEIKISEICIDLTNDVLDSASRGPSGDSQSVNSSNPSIYADFNVLEQPVSMKRRKGTRNRPMSTKALEALQTSLNHKEDKSRKPLHTIQDNSLRNHQ
ncbi:hypothetical protein ACFE04_027134 [Oxalis oulophora]